MAKEKKVVLFIVEGHTEQTALGLLLESIFTNERVMFDVICGDLTLNCGTKAPRDVVREEVKAHLDRGPGYRWGDLLKIVQICDVDGAFVPESAVVRFAEPSEEHESLVYGENSIMAVDPAKIILRNSRKSEAMIRLSSVQAITMKKRKVDYQLLYLSRNMEHALHDRPDSLTDRQKIALANRFRRKFEGNPKGFLEFLNSPEVAVAGDFRETWDYLQEDCNSLKRGSNLHLGLPSPEELE